MNKNKYRKKGPAVAVCDECKHEYLIEGIELKEAQVELNGTMVILVYFVCSKCNKIYRVSIQDARYYDLKEDLEKTKGRIRKNYGSGNVELGQILSNMVIKKHERLKSHVEKVNDMFPGTFTFAVSENNPKEKIIKYLP